MPAAERVSSIPERIGRYRLTGIIGQGGMGVVYRARDPRDESLVAIKTVSAPREYDVGGIRREIHALRRLSHPGVVRIIDDGLEAGVPWYAMELLEGQTLGAYNRTVWGPRKQKRVSEIVSTRVVSPTPKGAPKRRLD